MADNIRWDGVEEMKARMEEYGRKVHEAVVAVAKYWEPIIEAEAKRNAPWTDQTGNARQGLTAWTLEFSKDTVYLFLSHSVDYGIFLETRWAGRWSIIWPTLQQHIDPIGKMLQDIFK